MLKQEFATRLKSTIQVCQKHHQRMKYALVSLGDIFPVDAATYHLFSPEQIGHTDQFLYRFSQLQDTLGRKLFPLILEGLGEYDQGMAFIDMLNRLERLQIIDSAQQWLDLREIRNLVTHEYPENEKEVVEGLNELHVQSEYLETVLQNSTSYIQSRGWL